ncbi:unnamed protein product [Adineta ricciae]|uniref:Uncharacterized protein n=1 Tax=Adineta ricciae TaxID=249248 RepID=A0A813W417_ADIRI|nr:unnamed protein product [Adineta ricciae]
MSTSYFVYRQSFQLHIVLIIWPIKSSQFSRTSRFIISFAHTLQMKRTLESCAVSRISCIRRSGPFEDVWPFLTLVIILSSGAFQFKIYFVFDFYIANRSKQIFIILPSFMPRICAIFVSI